MFSGCSSNTTAVEGLIGTVCTLSKINLALALILNDSPANNGFASPPVLTDSSLVELENDSFHTAPFSPISGLPPSTTGFVFVTPIIVLRPALSKLVSILAIVLLVVVPSVYIVSPTLN